MFLIFLIQKLHKCYAYISHSMLYWSDVGLYPKVGKSSMDGHFNGTILNTTSSYYKLVFTLDRSKQVLYWIRGPRSCYLESSNTDGSNRSIVHSAIRYDGRCSDYYYMYSNYFQSMDFFGGAVYTYSDSPYSFNRYIYRTTTDTRSYITSINSYMSYICSSYPVQEMKVVSRQHQLQSKQFCIK